MARKCVKFYVKCWKHQNEAYYNEDKQKERIKKWFIKEREKARSSEMNQVRDYVQRITVNEDRCAVETLEK